MSKPFNIHDWQAKQTKQNLNEGVWEIGSKQAIQEFINKLKQLKNVYYNIVGSDEVQNGLDAALRGAEELMRHAKDNPNELEEMNSLGASGAGASMNTGNSMAYATPNAFKKKRKDD